MSSINSEINEKVQFATQIELMRKELRNMRAQMRGLKEMHKKEVIKLQKAIKELRQCKCNHNKLRLVEEQTQVVVPTKIERDIEGIAEQVTPISQTKNSKITFRPIGRMEESWFTTKNGTPRQPTICRQSKGMINVEEMKSNFRNCSNPHYALENLCEFSHIWIIFYFDQSVHDGDTSNECNPTFAKTKIAPPRLGGKRVGLFSTRSPHRPNLIGLTLGKLETVIGTKIYVSGIDLLQGTPILDIKPYIPQYDMPPKLLSVISSEQKGNKDEEEPLNKIASSRIADVNNEQPNSNSDESVDNLAVKTPLWINNESLKVIFTQRSLNDIDNILISHEISPKKDLIASIVSILQADPRSCYRKDKCSDRLYYFTLNNRIHVTAWFDEQHSVRLDSTNRAQEIVAEVLKVSHLPSNISVNSGAIQKNNNLMC